MTVQKSLSSFLGAPLGIGRCPKVLLEPPLLQAGESQESHVSIAEMLQLPAHLPGLLWSCSSRTMSLSLGEELLTRHSRNLLGWLCPAVLSSQEVLGWSESPMRSRACGCEDTPLSLPAQVASSSPPGDCDVTCPCPLFNPDL